MIPFAVLGFVMKPLQLKGIFFWCIGNLLRSYKHFPAISKSFLSAGFAPAESKKALRSVETADTEVQGAVQCFPVTQ